MNSLSLLRLIGLLILLSGTALAQPSEDLPFRRVYVPENQVESWPEGNWQPTSTARLLQAQSKNVPRMLQSRDGRVKQAVYQATYSDGNLMQGTLELELAADEELAGWVRFGKPDLILESMSWSQTPESRSSDRWGIDKNDRFVIFADGNTKRLTGTWSSPGEKNGQVVEFQLRLMAAAQSSFTLNVPEELQVSVDSISEVVTYVSEAKNGFRTWTIMGLEEERLTLTVQPEPTRITRSHQINQTVHLINVSASGAAFTSDFQLAASQESARSCLIWIPQEFRIQSAGLNLDDVSRRLVNVESQAENGRAYRLNLTSTESSKAVTLRVRGKIELTSDGRLTTLFPKILNELSLEGEVNLTIDAPYQVKSLRTSGLMQKSAKFTDGTRDIWSYDVIDLSPEIKLQVIFPDAELKIDQIIHCRDANDQLLIYHDMLWAPTAPGFYHGNFQLTNNYLVTQVRALNEIGEELPLNWTTERRNGKNHLFIDLANQISLRKPILVRISLKSRTPLERQQTISFPILTPVNGRIDKSLISTRSIAIVRTIPPQNQISEAIDGPAYTLLKKMTSGLEPNAWSENSRIDDVSVINRFIIRRRQNEELPPMVVDDLPAIQNQCELETVIFEDRGKLFAQHLIKIPALVAQSMNSLTWEMSAKTSGLSWKRSLAETSSTTDTSIPSVQLYSNTSGSAESSWSLLWNSSPTAQGFQFEAVVPIPLTKNDTLALPELLNGTPYSTHIMNQATELCELKTFSGAAQDEVVTELNSFHSDPRPELTVHRLDTISPENAEITFTKLASWTVSLYSLMSEKNDRTIDCELQCVNVGNRKETGGIEFEFPEPIFLKSVQMNETVLEINQAVTKYRLPETTDQLQKVLLSYACESRDGIVLPTSKILPARIQFVVCQSRNDPLKVTSEFPFWKFAQLESDEFSQSSLKTRMQKFVKSGTHQIYETEISIPESQTIHLSRPQETTSWKWMIWLFGMSSILFYFLYAYHWVPILWMLISAGTLTLLISLFPGSDRIGYFYPIISALLIVAQLAPSLERWRLEYMADNPPKKTTDSNHPLRTLLLGRTFLICLIILSLNNLAHSQTDQTSDAELIARSSNISVEDVLIPIPQANLTADFKGLSLVEFPAVVYVRNQYAEKLRTQLTNRQEGNDILFHAANYSLQPDGQGEFVIHCEFDLLEKGVEPLSRFVLPITGISRISALRAEVNGQTVNMTPSPGNQGLEIPLNSSNLQTPEILPSENSFLSGSFGRQSSPFRRYRISVDVLPQQTNLTSLVRLTMNLPTSAKSTFSYPHNLSKRLRFPEHNAIPVSVEPTGNHVQDRVSVKLGSIDHLLLEIDNISAEGDLLKVNPINVTEVNMLLELRPQQIELTWQLGVNIVENNSRKMELLLPANIFIQDIVGAKQIAISKQDKESSEYRVTLEVSHKSPGKAVCVIRFLATLPAINRESILRLPQIVDNGSSRSTQLAVQTAVPGYELSCQFVDAITSRMTQESFQSLWNEAAAVQQSAQCFRVQNAQSLRLGLHPMPTQLNIQSDLVYQVEQKEIFLKATYQGLSSGGPLWSFACNNESGWNAESVTMVSDNQTIGVRRINEGNQFHFLFEQPVNESFSMNVIWKKRRNLKSIEIDSTPPRILTATSLTESARVINSISRTQWSLSTYDEQNFDHSRSNPLILKWTDKQSFQDLPNYKLQKVESENLQESSELGNRLTDNPKSTDVERLTNENEIRDLVQNQTEMTLPVLDHTIFQEGHVWNGETLVFWPPTSTTSNAFTSTIQIPAGCEILSYYPSDGLNVNQSSDSLSIEKPEQIQLATLLIHWKSAKPTTAYRDYKIQLPTPQSAAKTIWRIVNRNENKCPADRLLKTWSDNTQILDMIGREIISVKREQNLLTFETESQIEETQNIPSQTIDEFQRRIQTLLDQSDSPLHLGWASIADESWTTQSLTMYQSVVAAGSDSDAIPQVKAPNPIALNRWGLTLLTCIWGIGLVCFHATEKPLFRRRHLFVVSLMMIGLMLVLLTSSSS